MPEPNSPKSLGNKYEVVVEIPGTNDIKDLQKDGFSICLVKDVQQDGNKPSLGNVIFGQVPSDSVSEVNKFTWKEEYKVGMTKAFQSGLQVDVSTHEYEISGNEKIKFDVAGSGDFDSKYDKPDSTKPFLVRNEWQHYSRAVVFSKVQQPGSQDLGWTPFFVSKGLPIKTTINLTPVVTVGLFLKSDMSTGDMIALAKTDIFPIKFTELGKSKVVVTYEAGTWTLRDD